MFDGEPLSSTSISLSWDLPLVGERNGEITGYVIDITDLDSGETQRSTIGGMDFIITISDLRPFTIYVATIAATTDVGMGPFSSVVSVQTVEDGETADIGSASHIIPWQ